MKSKLADLSFFAEYSPIFVPGAGTNIGEYFFVALQEWQQRTKARPTPVRQKGKEG